MTRQAQSGNQGGVCHLVSCILHNDNLPIVCYLPALVTQRSGMKVWPCHPTMLCAMYGQLCLITRDKCVMFSLLQKQNPFSAIEHHTHCPKCCPTTAAAFIIPCAALYGSSFERCSRMPHTQPPQRARANCLQPHALAGLTLKQPSVELASLRKCFRDNKQRL
jgi:hypothetical protein